MIVISINYVWEEMIKNLQFDFDLLNGWLITNELYISEEKTIYMDITVPKMKRNTGSVIKVHGENCINMRDGKDKNCNGTCKKLETNNKTKYLGMIIDSNWNFKSHILNLTNKLRQMLAKLYQLKNVLDIKNKKIVYEAWVSSQLRYGIEIYGFASEYLIERLQKIQNKIIKMLFKTGNKTTKQLYQEHQIFRVTQLRDFLIITKNYYINKHKNYDVGKQIRLRDKSQRFQIPKWNNKYGLRNKRFYIPSIFNKLPKQLLTYQSIRELKTQLKKELIKQT